MSHKADRVTSNRSNRKRFRILIVNTKVLGHFF